jgi:hypothetical protein
MAKMFQRGYKAVQEEKVKAEKRREEQQKGLWRFFLTKDGEEADLSFLTEMPINFWEHTVPSKNSNRYDNIPCTGEGCTTCDTGDRSAFHSAWLVVDHREFEYTDKDGKKKKGKDQLRLFVYGIKIAGQLDRKSTKGGLVGREYTMVRIGKGQNTTYTFENRLDEDDNIVRRKYSSKEIEQLLPEALRESYDGTMESLYTIIEEQIEMLVGDPSDTSDDREDDENNDDDVRGNIIKTEEDEEENKSSRVARKSTSGAKSVKSLLRKK